MKRRNHTVVSTLLGVGLCCGTASAAEGQSADNPTVQEIGPKEIMARLATLEGDWVLLDENGVETNEIASRFRASSTRSGVMVMERMFPDSPDAHETVNVYQVEGERVYMIHYCAVANQPRAEVLSSEDDRRLEIKFEGVKNKRLPDTDTTKRGEYIFHGGVQRAEYIFHGKDRITTRWFSKPDNKSNENDAITFELKRKS